MKHARPWILTLVGGVVFAMMVSALSAAPRPAKPKAPPTAVIDRGNLEGVAAVASTNLLTNVTVGASSVYRLRITIQAGQNDARIALISDGATELLNEGRFLESGAAYTFSFGATRGDVINLQVDRNVTLSKVLLQEVK